MKAGEMPLFAYAEAREARDAAISQVVSHAPEGFTEKAAAFVRSYLLTHGPTPGEDITDACKAAGIQPHDDRAFGGVYMRLSRQGIITKDRPCQRRKGHLTAGGNVWKLT